LSDGTPYRAPWLRSGSFEVEDDPTGKINLDQLDTKHFALHSTLTYTGEETGLEGKVPPATLDRIRSVSPATLPTTDLASVPVLLRWFAGRYGIHTPAALIHDWLIPQPVEPPLEAMTNEYADRYFRYMLGDLGVPTIRRWLMWAAVAARSRFTSGWLNATLLVVWVIASIVGMITFVLGVVTGNTAAVVAATFAPFLFAGLWGRQYGAGIVAAYSAPWILPPTIFAGLGYLVYLALEWFVGLFTGER
jgi:hypothetical protein